MTRKRRPAPVPSAADTREWLTRAVHNAPRPLPAGRFPQILQQARAQGHTGENLLNVLDEWLNFGYCRLIDPIAQDIELTPEGDAFFR